MPGGNLAWDGPEGENALSAVSILLLAAPSPPQDGRARRPTPSASLPPSSASPTLSFPIPWVKEPGPSRVVGEVTEEENQYLVCLEKQQYFNC